jgi:two-component system OmpR family response regulator
MSAVTSAVTSAPSVRVLVVVKDSTIRRIWTARLRSLGYIVSSTADSVGAEMLLDSFSPDVVVLDVDLPWRQYVGDPISAVLRRTHAWLIVTTPSSAASEHDRLLEVGAHYVITITQETDELMSALSFLAGSRRDEPEVPVPAMTSSAVSVPIHGHACFGSLSIDVDRRVVTVDDHEVPLTRIEFDLLVELCRKPRGVSLRRDLLASIWGQSSDSDAHIVDVHLSNMRRKLAAAKPGTRFVQTVRGIGFRLSDALLQNTHGAPALSGGHSEGSRVASSKAPSAQKYIALSHHRPVSTAAR